MAVNRLMICLPSESRAVPKWETAPQNVAWPCYAAHKLDCMASPPLLEGLSFQALGNLQALKKPAVEMAGPAEIDSLVLLLR